ncbi:penicillin-binding transpeptidase domain-containing protein [Metabacillus niabensis]|uniref:Penicillin-binding protein n=1 Tax=Metabacillus niabensis TaxID=324854 RepID=A0ABT9YVH5_9BACI|nr:penicillin-binding transpeptidase domain-containing protein [Metabacillus niabensis]MDQ0223992.1 penicillin-binding protein [Metabacillus niabensis]
MKKNKLFFVLLLLPIYIGLMVGCSTENKQSELFERFSNRLSEQDFQELYAFLAAESKEYITEEEFVSRYKTIYSGIEAKNIRVTNVDIDSEENIISFSIEMETVAGKVSVSDYRLPLQKEEGEWKIVWDESLIFPAMKQGDKVKVSSLKAIRGSILDRNGIPLAMDGDVKTVGINPAVFDESNREKKIMDLAAILDISKEYITKRLEENANPNYFVPIVDLLVQDERLIKLEQRRSEGIFVNDKTSRVYVNQEAFGRLVGYVGNISAEELEKHKDKGYKNTALIGKAGLEQVYEDSLRGIDGIEIYIERNGEKIETIAKQAPKNGKDIKLTIDSNLQSTIYEHMDGEKGSAAAVHPKTGEVLALVSSPSYNSNRYTTYVTREEQKRREAIEYEDEANRFSKLYSPGSVFKLITAAEGLEKGVIDPNQQISIQGRSWQKDRSWGNYSITRVNSQSSVNLKNAVKYSDNIYFAMSALQLGSEPFILGAKKFGIGEELEIGYPLSRSQISNNGKLDGEILLADSGYGQGEVMVTSLNIALIYSALSNDGNIMAPSLIQQENKAGVIWKESAISAKHLPTLQQAFSAVIQESGGTASTANISGVSLAGKTGTAEIKASQDDENGSENGWFVATDIDSSTISLAIVLEDVKEKGGSSAAVPVGKEALVEYFK